MAPSSRSVATFVVGLVGSLERCSARSAAEMFGQLDITNNGLINKLELRQASSVGLMADLGLPEHTAFLTAADLDGNQMVSELEMQEFLVRHESPAPAKSSESSPLLRQTGRTTASSSTRSQESDPKASLSRSDGHGSAVPAQSDDEMLKEFIEKGFVEVRVPVSEMPRAVHRQIYERVLQLWEGAGRTLGAGLGNNLLPAVPELQALLASTTIKNGLKAVLGPNYVLHSHRFLHHSR